MITITRKPTIGTCRTVALCSTLALLMACSAGAEREDLHSGGDAPIAEPSPPTQPADQPNDLDMESRPIDLGTCSAGKSACGDLCVDLRRDATNCGECDHACSGGRSCTDGVCKLDAWITGFVGRYSAGTRDVAVGPSGEIVVVGAYYGELEQAIGGGVSQGANDAFVAKLDAHGRLMWLRRFGGAGNEEATDVAIDAEGRIAIAGHFDARFSITADPLVSKGDDDIFVAELSNDDGSPRWAQSYGDALAPGAVTLPQAQRPTALAFDAYGRLLLAGVFSGNLGIGAEVLQGADDLDTFVVMLDAAAQPRWIHSYSGPGDQVIADIAIDSLDSVILAGNYEQKIVLGSYALSEPQKSDGFVAKIDRVGNVRWLEPHGDRGPETVTALAVDRNSDAIVVVGIGALPNLMRYDTNGTPLNGTAVPSASAYIADIAVAPSGDIWLTGSLDGELDLGMGLMQSDSEDALVLLYNAELQPLWSHRYGSAARDYAVAIATSAAGDAVFVGDFGQTFDDTGAPIFSSGVTNAFVAGLSL